MPLFNAISPLNGGDLHDYYNDREYPYDLNGALDFCRPATGVAIFPFPLVVPTVQGLLPIVDRQEYALMMGALPKGPVIDLLYNPAAASSTFPAINGGMVKVRG